MGLFQSKSKSLCNFGPQETKGETPPFRTADIEFDSPLEFEFPGGINNLVKAFEYFHSNYNRSIRNKQGSEALFGTREKRPNNELGNYVWKSYDEVHEIVTSLAKTFEELNLCHDIEDQGRHVRTLGLFCKTSEEWVFTWMAMWYVSGCVVPLYDTLGEESIEWIIKQAELKTVVTTTPFIEKLANLKLAGNLEFLKTVITIENPSEEVLEILKKSGVKVLKFWECIEMGKKSKETLRMDATPDTVATICYTSGTTSKPKGVILTHRNYLGDRKSVV